MQEFELGRPGLSLLQRLIDDVRLLVIGSQCEPTEAEFDAHIVEAIGLAPAVRAVMVVMLSDAAVLSPERRVKLARAELLDTPTAVLTASIRIRGMLTPINWLGGKVKPFAHHQFEDACNYLEIPPESRDTLRNELTTMRNEMTGGEKGEDRRSRSGTFAAVRRAVAAGFAIVRGRTGGDGGRF
jgi:hypothetical protein